MLGWVRLALPVVLLTVWIVGCNTGPGVLSGGNAEEGTSTAPRSRGVAVANNAELDEVAANTGTEACCFDDGTCADLDAMDCMDQGGHPQGMGSACDAVDCGTSDLTVAGCFDNDTCADLGMTPCMDQGGHSQGMGSTCDTSDCAAGCDGHGGGHCGGHHGGGS